MKRTEIEGLLPGVFQRTIVPGSPLAALLEVMEGLHSPSESILAQLDTYLEPYQAPPEFVPFIAGWLDLERFLTRVPEKLDVTIAQGLFPSGLGHLRELIAAAAYLSKWRGTAKGLIRFLETATGESGFTIDEHVVDESNRQRPFHIQVHAPIAAEPYQPLIERIIELEKPAYVTYELQFNK